MSVLKARTKINTFIPQKNFLLKETTVSVSWGAQNVPIECWRLFSLCHCDTKTLFSSATPFISLTNRPSVISNPARPNYHWAPMQQAIYYVHSLRWVHACKRGKQCAGQLYVVCVCVFAPGRSAGNHYQSLQRGIGKRLTLLTFSLPWEYWLTIRRAFTDYVRMCLSVVCGCSCIGWQLKEKLNMFLGRTLSPFLRSSKKTRL